MLGSFSLKSLDAYQAIAQQQYPEDGLGVYDFARCVRPDGSTYGTKGRCKPPNKPIRGDTTEQPDSDGKDLPQGTRRVTVSMGGYSVGINVNTNRSNFPGRRVGGQSDRGIIV